MKLYSRRRLRRTTVICCALAALMGGVFLAYYGLRPSGLWILLLPCAIPLLLRPSYGRVVGVILVMAAAGIWRGSILFQQLQKYQPLYHKQVGLQGIVADDPSYNSERQQTEFHVTSLAMNGQKLPGKIQVRNRQSPKVSRGNRVLVAGTLRPSLGTSRQGTMSATRVVVVTKNKSLLERARQKFFFGLTQNLPEPHASVGAGYLVGLRANILKELNDQLSVVGLTHIIAVSGYNLTILVRAARRLVGRYSAYQSLIFSLLLVGSFVLVAGGSASINRAAVVCVLGLVAWYYGRAFKPLLLLLSGGAITSFANPLYIWGDPGWWLSFLAFTGVLILAPLITRYYFRKKPPGTILQILIETLCAQACTLPYTMYLFGGVSLIAPVANVLVLPLIPFIMLAIFIMGLCSMVMPDSAAYLGIIPNALLTFQLWAIETLSKVPWAHSAASISVGVMGGLALALVIFTLTLHCRVKRLRPSTAPEIEYNLV